MAYSLRPCPACARPMDASRAVCAFCQQKGIEPTIQLPPPAAPAPRARTGQLTSEKFDMCAVLSGIFALLGYLVFGLIFGLTAIVLGAVSLVRINNDPELKGRGVAIFGMAAGLLAASFGIYMVNKASTDFLKLTGQLPSAAPPAASSPADAPYQPSAPPETDLQRRLRMTQQAQEVGQSTLEASLEQDRARAKEAHARTCQQNLKLLDAVKQQWAIDFHKSARDIPTPGDLCPTYLQQLPNCPDGGAYHLGAVENDPTCSYVATDLEHREQAP